MTLVRKEIREKQIEGGQQRDNRNDKNEARSFSPLLSTCHTCCSLPLWPLGCLCLRKRVLLPFFLVYTTQLEWALREDYTSSLNCAPQEEYKWRNHNATPVQLSLLSLPAPSFWRVPSSQLTERGRRACAR